MASILDLVKHYQHAIEKYPSDEQKILKSIDKLFNLGVTVQHLQETGVGRTVNALRKEPGDVGKAARALVYKWKLMVAAEESDHDEDHNQSASHNGHENGKTPEDSDYESKHKPNQYNEYNKTQGGDSYSNSKHMNGNYSGSKRKQQSSEDDEPNVKKSRQVTHNEAQEKILDVRVKKEQSETEHDSVTSHSDEEVDSGSEESAHDEKSSKQSFKNEFNKHMSSSRHSKQSNQEKYEKEYSSDKSQENIQKHSKHSHSESRNTDKTSKDSKSSSADRNKKEKDTSSHRKEKSSDKEKKEKEKKDKKECKEESSSKHRSGSEKHRSIEHSDKRKSHSEKSTSKSEKHSSSSHKEKSDKDKHKHSSDKSSDKHKSREHSSSKDKDRSSSKDKVMEKCSSSKDKENSHRSDKKHSSSSENGGKSKSESKDDRKSSKEKKSHTSSASSSKSSKSSSSKSKDIPKKKSQQEKSTESDDGIDCGSGASFAEALGMISPSKPKKKSSFVKDTSFSPNNSGSTDDMTPAALLAPNAQLAPLPALEISALPEISPHYKPRPPPKFLPHFTDEDAISAGISSKNQRTKVYSGNKVLGKIPSLYEMCVQILQEHIDALEYTGGVPYEILKPVVDRATPQQLYMLEHFNPYLMEDTDHLWQKFCEKSFRNKKRQELESWREMFMRCQEEQESRLKSLTANIRIAQEAKKAPIKQTKMAYVDTVVKPPRNIARKQAQHGTAFAASASPAARVSALSAAPNVLKGGARAAPVIAVPTGAFQKPKKAPLMQKALQFMRGRKR